MMAIPMTVHAKGSPIDGKTYYFCVQIDSAEGLSVTNATFEKGKAGVRKPTAHQISRSREKSETVSCGLNERRAISDVTVNSKIAACHCARREFLFSPTCNREVPIRIRRSISSFRAAPSSHHTPLSTCISYR